MLGLEPIVRTYIAWTVRQRGGLDLEAMREIWPIVVGRTMARRTRPKALRGTRLEVGVPDGTWLSELRFHTNRILERINRMLPDSVGPIGSVRFSVGGHPEWSPEPDADGEASSAVPLTAEQREALEQIADPELRAVVARVIERDSGRLR